MVIVVLWWLSGRLVDGDCLLMDDTHLEQLVSLFVSQLLPHCIDSPTQIMPPKCLPPHPLRLQLFLLPLLPLQLLHPQIMVVHRHAQHPLRPILAHDILIQVLLEHARRQSRRAEDGSSAKRAGGWLTGLIAADEWLRGEVGAGEVG